MHVDATEKKWLYISIAMTAFIIGLLAFHAIGNNMHPPSNVEPINSDRLHVEGEFMEDNLGVKEMPDGSVEVRMVAARYGFYPQEIEVPAETPVKFRIASADVLHGFHVPYTNLATMVVPGIPGGKMREILLFQLLRSLKHVFALTLFILVIT